MLLLMCEKCFSCLNIFLQNYICLRFCVICLMWLVFSKLSICSNIGSCFTWCFVFKTPCPNTEFFLVRIFLHSDWIRRDTRIWTLFTFHAVFWCHHFLTFRSLTFLVNRKVSNVDPSYELKFKRLVE